MYVYDYKEALRDDILEYIEENVDDTLLSEFDDEEEMYEWLEERLWKEDGVTGNASGSYTFNTYQAEENICHNLELLSEALTEFGCGPDYLMEKGPEAADVAIRCYLLGEVLSEVIREELKDRFDEIHEEMEECPLW